MTSLARSLRLFVRHQRQKPPQATTVLWWELPTTTNATRRCFSTTTTVVPSPQHQQLIQQQLQQPLRNRPYQYSSCCCHRSFSSKTSNKDDDDPAQDVDYDSRHDGGSTSLTTPGEDSAPAQEEYQIPGAQAGGKKLAIVYTCNVCNTRSIKQFSEHSYQHGVVLVRCPGCQSLHLIADRLGIFDGDGDWDIQKAMAKLGENVNVVNNENVLEMNLQDLIGEDAIEKLSKGINTKTKTETKDNDNDSGKS